MDYLPGPLDEFVDPPRDFLDIVRGHLPFADDGPLQATDSFTDLGLDSMGLVALLADLEDRYDVVLPDGFVTEQTFASIGSLWASLLAVLADGVDAA